MTEPSEHEIPHIADAPWLWILAVVTAVVALSLTEVGRAGYTPDEELTHFAVAGISRDGVPRMPSGVLYERGLPYSYLARMASAFSGGNLTSYRAVSLFWICVVLVLAYVVASAMRGARAVIAAAALTASSVWILLAAQWARFYAMFLAFFLLTFILFVASRKRHRSRILFLVSLFLSRLLHESAVTLIALPLFAYLSERGADARRRSARILIETAAVLVGAQLLLYAALYSTASFFPVARYASFQLLQSFATPPLHVASQATSLTSYAVVAAYALSLLLCLRWFSVPWGWACAYTLACLPFQLGIVLLIAIAAMLTRSPSWRRIASVGVLAGFTAVLFWTVHTVLVTDAAFSLQLTVGLSTSSSIYPWACPLYTARYWPVLVVLLGCTLGWSLVRPEAEDSRRLAFLLLSGAVFLGILNIGLKPRYLLFLLPLSFVLVSITIVDIVALFRLRQARTSWLVGAAAIASMVLLHREEGSASAGSGIIESCDSCSYKGQRLTTHPTTAWAAALEDTRPDDVVVCNDDLACSFVIGRIDWWFPTNRFDVVRFGLRTPDGLRAVYSGARILETPEELQTLVDSNVGRRVRIVILKTPKYGFTQYESILAEVRFLSPRTSEVSRSDGIVVVDFH